MKIELNKLQLIKALEIGGSYANKSKNVIPISECIKFEIKDNILRIYSTDGESSISNKYGTLQYDDISYCIPFAQLYKYILAVNSDSVYFEDNIETNSINILHDDGKITFPLFKSEEFPSIEIASKDDAHVNIDADILKYWMNIGEPFLINDEMKPQNESFYYEQSELTSRFSCTDGSFAAITGTDDAKDNASVSFLLRKNNIKKLLMMIGDSSNIMFWNKENHIIFAGNGTLLSIRKKEIVYYNYKQLYTGEKPIKCTINRLLLLQSLRRAQIASDISNGLIILQITKNSINITSDNGEGSKCDESFACECNDEITIGFNYDKLVKCINAFQSECININLNTNVMPALITSDHSDIEVMIMPCQI